MDKRCGAARGHRAAALAPSSSASGAAGRTIAQQSTTLAKADSALGKVNGKWLLGLPCPMVVLGGGFYTKRPLDPQLQITAGFPIVGKGQC